MSSITTDPGILHYGVYGRGKPLILLRGRLGLWGLWQDTIAYLGRYDRTCVLDFWGCGESGKKLATYQVDDFVDLVNQFMDRLGLVSPLVALRSMAFLLFTFFDLFCFGMRLASPLICRDPRFADRMDRNLSQTTPESFLTSIASLRRTDVHPHLSRIAVPVKGMYGMRDTIVHPHQGRVLRRGLPHAELVECPRARALHHAR